jgi:hypothetical protein
MGGDDPFDRLGVTLDVGVDRRLKSGVKLFVLRRNLLSESRNIARDFLSQDLALARYNMDGTPT